jgi:hypothetical protein
LGAPGSGFAESVIRPAAFASWIGHAQLRLAPSARLRFDPA